MTPTTATVAATAPRPIAKAEAWTPVVKLSAAEGGISEGVAERIALGEHDMRRGFADGIQRVFVIGNAALWIMVLILIVVDTTLIAEGWQTPKERIIDSGVVKVLVAGTVVQVGLIMVAVAGNLFPKVRADDRSFWKRWFG